MNDRKMISFEDWESEKLTDEKFVAAAEELEPSYQITRLRLAKGLTQKELAEKSGTKQPFIARIEHGTTSPTLSSLKKIGKALDTKVYIQFVQVRKSSLINDQIKSNEDQSWPNFQKAAMGILQSLCLSEIEPKNVEKQLADRIDQNEETILRLLENGNFDEALKNNQALHNVLDKNEDQSVIITEIKKLLHSQGKLIELLSNKETDANRLKRLRSEIDRLINFSYEPDIAWGKEEKDIEIKSTFDKQENEYSAIENSLDQTRRQND